MDKRKVKRILIAFSFLFILFILFFIIYIIKKPQPTCSDGIKNQLEEGVDCGGSCAPCEEKIVVEDIQVKNIEWVDTAIGNFDTVVTIKNPNNRLGASTIKYRLKYLDQNNKVVKETRWLDDFILPEQEKYLLIQEIEVPENFTKIKVDFGDIIWKKFTAQQQKPRLEVIMTEFTNSFQQDLSGFYRVVGTLVNESAIDLESIKIKVVLRDNQGSLLSTNSQVINSVRSKEKRDFNIPFPSDYNMDRVEKVEIKPETNIFNSQNSVIFYGISDEIK